MLAQDQTQGVPERVVAALQAGLGDRLVAVVLFGSRARGDARPESDWDLLVIARDLPVGRLARHFALQQLLPPECRGVASLLAKTPDEFESHLPALYLDIALDGQILYDLDGYVGERLGRLRGLIDRVGLYREHRPAGDVWQWRQPPAGHWSLQWRDAADGYAG